MKIKLEVIIDTIEDQEEIDSFIDAVKQVKELIENQKKQTNNKGKN